MGNLTTATRFTRQSAPLTNGQEYRFTIRIATASWPTGLETQNTDPQAATADSPVPASPLLDAAVV